MKLKVKHFNPEDFRSKLDHLNHLDVSIFVDDTPKLQEDLSTYNILVLQEPNEYFGLHDWALSNKNLFNLILTWDDKLINQCQKAILMPFGHTWFKPNQYNTSHPKKFQTSHLCGKLLKTYGHSLRHELLARQNEIKNPIKFFDVYGDRYDIENARKGKEEVFGDSMFGVAIENTSHRGYFTEKILDCFLLKTIPIYWGCSNIGDYFNKEGIIRVDNVDDMIYVINSLDENFYNSRKEAIQENWELAKNYIDYEQNVVDTITKIFKHNNLI
jgi:hypothetical protein